jgi:hypothetical protein
MGKFSKEIPLNPDSSLGPVTIGSKIVVERGKGPLPLQGGNVVLVPGSGWSPGTVTISPEMDKGGTKLNILVILAKEISLSHYTGVILKKKPIQLEVTLFPKMMVPGMGVPVTVSAAPITDEVNVTIPAIKQPEIGLDAKFNGKAADGTYNLLVTATLELPPYISQAEKDTVIRNLTIDVKDKKNVTVEKGAMTQEGAGKTLELTASPDFKSKEGTAMITVASEVNLAGLPLSKTKQVSLEIGRKYILNIHPASLDVTMKKSGSLTAKVLEEMPDGQKVLLSDAVIGLGGGSGILAIAPDKGTGEVEFTVTQQKISEEKKISLTVSASAGNDSITPQTVSVIPETAGGGSLEVAFDPESKNSLDPFIGTDRVILKARVTHAGNQVVGSTISFDRVDPNGWIDNPSGQVDYGEGWTAVALEARPPDPDHAGDPPASEEIRVTAAINGTVIDEKSVQVVLLPRSRIEVTPTELHLLGSSPDRPGIVSPKQSDAIRLSVLPPGREKWDFTVEPDAESAGLIAVSAPDADESGAVFTISVVDGLKPKDPPIGPDAWRRYAVLHAKATSGSRTVEGPDAHVSISFEGLYIEGIYHREKGYWKSSGKEDHVTLRSDLPSDDPDRARRVKFVAMVWDGTDVREDSSQVDGDHLEFSEPVAEDKDANTILSFQDFSVTYSEDLYEVDHSWNFSLRRFIPGDGTVLNVTIDASNECGTLSIPIEIVTGKLDLTIGTLTEEQTKLFRFIRDVIPNERPEYNLFIKDLAEFGKKHAGSEDYTTLRAVVWEEAQRIWQEDQQDYLTWAPWEGTVLKTLSAVKTVGDFSFSIVIGYYTRSLSFGGSFASQQAASLLKDELISFFNYYTEQYANGNDNVEKVALEYATEHCLRILEGVATGGLEAFILKNFNHKKPDIKILVLFFVWKFGYHKFRPKPNGEYSSWGDAIKDTLWDMGNFAFMVLFQDFVNANGNKTLREVYDKVNTSASSGTRSEPGDESTKNGEKLKDDGSKDKTGKKEDAGKGQEDPKIREKDLADKKSDYEKAKENYDKITDKNSEEAREARKKLDETKSAYEKQLAAPEVSKAKENAKDHIEKSKDKVDETDRKAFEEGRETGREKVDKLSKAWEDLQRNPDSPEAKKKFADACAEVQKDKHAMHVLNDEPHQAGGEIRNPGEESPLRRDFNEHWKDTYENTDQRVKQRIADQANKDLKPGEQPYGPEDIETAKITNVKDKTPKTPDQESKKSTFDRDVTYRKPKQQIRIDPFTGEPVIDIKTGKPIYDPVIDPKTGKPQMEDIITENKLITGPDGKPVKVDGRTVREPGTGSRDIYSQEFYKERNGDYPYKTDDKGKIIRDESGKPVIDQAKCNEFAKQYDQTVTDRYNTDAYGGGQQDIGPATRGDMKGKPYVDVEATSKTMVEKVDEWQRRNSEEKPPELSDKEWAAKKEENKEESMRQLTKQFKNQIEPVVNKYNELAGYPDPPVAKIPENVRTGFEIMDKVGKMENGKMFTPADAEAALSHMDETPKSIVEKMAGVLESGQKHMSGEQKQKLGEYLATLPEN